MNSPMRESGAWIQHPWLSAYLPQEKWWCLLWSVQLQKHERRHTTQVGGRDVEHAHPLKKFESFPDSLAGLIGEVLSLSKPVYKDWERGVRFYKYVDVT